MPGSDRAFVEGTHPFNPFSDTVLRPVVPRSVHKTLPPSERYADMLATSARFTHDLLTEALWLFCRFLGKWWAKDM
eukprot:39542-Amphidinium_carterae.1